MKKEMLIWQAVFFILGLLVVFTIREHLQDNTKISAEVAKANCIFQLTKLLPKEEGFEVKEDRFGVCRDIKTYKLRGDFIK